MFLSKLRPHDLAHHANVVCDSMVIFIISYSYIEIGMGRNSINVEFQTYRG